MTTKNAQTHENDWTVTDGGLFRFAVKQANADGTATWIHTGDDLITAQKIAAVPAMFRQLQFIANELTMENGVTHAKREARALIAAVLDVSKAPR